MLINVSILRKFVDMPADLNGIEALLIRAGVEVEESFVRAEQLKDIVIGEVKRVEPVDGADDFFVSSVDVGQGDDAVIPIVHSNAYIVNAGMRVPVALPGTVLPTGIKVQASEVKGVMSQGMICPDRDLGIIAAGDGLQSFDDSVEPGAKLVDVAPPDDIVLDVAITPNRGDMLSHFGIAREIAAVTGLPLNEPERIPVLDDLPPGDVPITIDAPELCSQYIGVVVDKVTVKPSPEWMKTALISVGIRPINNLVDLTNYVMIEVGNPLHAFDRTLLKGGIHVGAAKHGDTITLLDDDRAVELTPGVPLIMDDSGPIALAGVMGGAKHSIMDDTSALFLEAALFNPVAIRRSARAVMLKTDSSYRFERGVDKDSIDPAVRRTLYLLEGMLPDCRIRGVNIAQAPLPSEEAIPVTLKRAYRDVGVPLSENDVADMLAGFGWHEAGDDAWRPDRRRYYIDEPLDAMEDIARAIGYDAIPVLPPDRLANTVAVDSARAFRRRVVESMAKAGFQEAVTLSLTPKEMTGHFGLLPQDKSGDAIPVRNPISEEYACVRDSLAASLVDRARFNYSQGIRSFKLFELAPVFVADPDSDTTARYVWTLGVAAIGADVPGDWQRKEQAINLHRLAGWVLNQTLGALLNASFRLEPKSVTGLDDSASAIILIGDERVGAIGKVDKTLVRKWKSPADLVIMELDIDRIRNFEWAYSRITVPSKQPPLLRDVSITVPDGTRYDAIETTIRKHAGEYLEVLRLYDLYTGSQVDKGRFSLTFSLTFRAPDRALTDDEINAVMDTLIAALKETHQATLRL